MNIQNSDILFLVVIGLAAYAYAGFSLYKTPDPTTEYGFSLNALLAFLVAFGTSLVAFVIVIATGVIGYFIVAVILPPIIRKVVKKMTASENIPAT